MRLRTPVICGLAVVSLLASCRGSAKTEGPGTALTAYFNAIGEGNFRDAFALLSEGSRRRLEEAGAASRQSGLELFRSRMTAEKSGAPWITRGAVEKLEIAVAREDAGTAVVAVRGPLGTQEIRMVLEDGAWRVELKP